MARYLHTVDAKGRMFIPAKIREELGKIIYITKSIDEESLSGYTSEQFGYLKDQIKGLNALDPNVRKLRRQVLGEAISCEVDSQGRVSVSEELWNEINVKSGEEVYIIYLFEKFEIWSKSAYDLERKTSGTNLSEDLIKYDIKGI